MRFNIDSPISRFDEDKLNFTPYARGVARLLMSEERPTGFVVGINGPWGSGKTSLLNLVETAIGEAALTLDKSKRPLSVRYSPWLVKNRDGLLQELLPVLVREVRRRIPWYRRPRETRQAIRALTTYARGIKGAEVGWDIGTATATLFGVAVAPWLAWIPSSLGMLAKLAGVNPKPLTLDELRGLCQRALLRANIRLLVFFDDLDRLDPSEIVDIARVVKSTLDLPHVTFLLAYDRPNVAASITSELHLDGDAYLEKIIQLSINVPSSSSYDLSQLMADQLKNVFPTLSEEQSKRVSIALWRDVRTLFLETPRDVGRLANSVAFGWHFLNGMADAGDHLLISALRTKAPTVYEWCRKYSETYHVERANWFDSKSHVAAFIQELEAACKADAVAIEPIRTVLRSILPGMESGTFESDKAVFSDETVAGAEQAIREQRLASSQHWTAYFDLSPGRRGFTDEWFAEFVNTAVVSIATAATRLKQVASRRDASGELEIERILDRIRAEGNGARLTVEARIALFRAIEASADEIGTIVGPAQFMGVSPFTQMEWTAEALLKPLPENTRYIEMENAIASGASLGWTAYFIRGELFAHGRAGDRERHGEALLEVERLDQLCAVARKRIAAYAAEGKLLSLEELIYPLLLWKEVGGETEARDWVALATSGDDGLLKFLAALKSLVRSTGGDFWRISPKLLSNFSDVESVKGRLNGHLASSDSEFREPAREALRMLEASREFE